MESIPWGVLGTLTPSGLVTLFVLLIFFDKLITKARLVEEQERTAYWRDIAEKKDQTISQLSETNNVLVGGYGETVAKVMTELQNKAGDDRT